jgi:hypothetical protein
VGGFVRSGARPTRASRPPATGRDLVGARSAVGTPHMRHVKPGDLALGLADLCPLDY